MKKKYMIPEMEVVEINIKQQLLAGSTKDAYDEEPEEYGAPAFDF